MSHKFQRGDRVRLSEEGRGILLRQTARTKQNALGTVGTSPRSKTMVQVIWDGARTGSYYHIDFIEKATSTERPTPSRKETR